MLITLAHKSQIPQLGWRVIAIRKLENGLVEVELEPP